MFDLSVAIVWRIRALADVGRFCAKPLTIADAAAPALVMES